MKVTWRLLKVVDTANLDSGDGLVLGRIFLFWYISKIVVPAIGCAVGIAGECSIALG